MLKSGAKERKGLQPVVTLTANGGERAEVSAGEEVTFEAVVETPPGTGSVVSADWDFEGTGEYPESSEIDKPAARMTFKKTWKFTEPGTYFPALKVSSEREGNRDATFARPENLGRGRVVVG